MQFRFEEQLLLAKELRAEEAREAARARQFARAPRPRPVRRAVGRVLVGLGQWLAAEAPLQPARFR
jgi:hypothetical protein